MRVVELKKVCSAAHLVKQQPKAGDYDVVIDEPCVFYKDGKRVGAYLDVPEDACASVRAAARATKFVKTYRAKRALPTQSSVFGALPRVAIRNDYCRISEKVKQEPGNASALFAFASLLARIYRDTLPDWYTADMDRVAAVLPEYLLPGVPFATVNINVNHAIRYHYDTGNFKGSLSNVLILRGGVQGGELVFPEYRIALAQRDRFVGIFDGQGEVHGVMPIRAVGPNPYRASIVYYTLENLKHCYPYEQELARIKRVASERAIKRAKGVSPLTGR